MKNIKSDATIIFNAIKSALCLKNEFNNISLHEPYFKDTNALKYVNDCIEKGWVSSAGIWVEKFEHHICQYTGAKHAVAVNNGTVGLRLSLHCVGVEAGDEVITSPLTFVATANAISHLGAFPHFIDIDSNNLSLSSSLISERLKKIAFKKDGKVFNRESGRRIAAILPVHVFGIPADVFEIKKISSEWDLPIVEDAAEAIGSRHYINENHTVHCGLTGDLGVISFNGNKLITTGGGGVIITNNEKLASDCRHLSTTAKKKHRWEFDHDAIGWNDRMPNINAALGLAQLEVIDKRIEQKINLLNKYKKFLAKIDDIEVFLDRSKNINNNWLINIRYINKDKKVAELRKTSLLEKSHYHGVFIRPAWKLLHKLEIYKNHPKTNLSIAEDQACRILSLPSSPQLNDYY